MANPDIWIIAPAAMIVLAVLLGRWVETTAEQTTQPIGEPMNPSDPIHLAAHEAATTLHRYLCETDRGLTCNEARAYANLLNELGIDTATFRSAHVRHDEDEDDDHHFGWVEPGDVEPGYNADLIEERRAAADA